MRMVEITPDIGHELDWPGVRPDQALAAIDRLDCISYSGILLEADGADRQTLSVCGCPDVGFLVSYIGPSVDLVAIGTAELKGSVDIVVGNQTSDYPRRELLSRETAWAIVRGFLESGRPSAAARWEDSSASRRYAGDDYGTRSAGEGGVAPGSRSATNTTLT